MKDTKFELPLITRLHGAPRRARVPFVIKHFAPEFMDKLPDMVETKKKDTFTALYNLARTFGTDDPKGVWAVEVPRDDHAHTMAFLRPSAADPEKQHITFLAGGNELSVVEAVDSTSEAPNFSFEYEPPQGIWIESIEVNAARKAGQLKKLVDFDALPLGQRLNTFEVLEDLAVAMTAEEGVQVYTAAVPGRVA